MVHIEVEARAPGLRRPAHRMRWTAQFALALLLAGTACASHAQFSGMGGGRRGGRSATDATRSSQPGGRPTSRWEEVSNRLYDIRLQLLISTEQGPAWQDFRTHFLDVAMAAASNPVNADEQTAAEAFQQQTAAAQQRASALTTLNTSVQALLAGFSEDQQRTANRTLPALLGEFIGHATGGEAGASAGR